MVRKAKVSLTQKEHQEFLLSAAMLHFNPPHLGWSAALLKVNETQPKDRQLGRQTIYTASKKWYKEIKGYPEKLYLVSQIVEEEKVEEKQEEIKETESLETLLNKLSDKIVNQLFERITKQLEEKVKEYKFPENWVSTTPSQPATKLTKPIKKKILVVGLLPIQQQEIYKAFATIFNLRFHESDENIHRLEHRVLWSDTIIINCTKISHKHQDMVKKVARNRQVKLVFGGVSSIKGALEGIKTQCLTTIQ